MNPLADRMRPGNLDEIVGQEHVIGGGKLLNRIIMSGMIPNMIFYGPSGTGKTTVAHILAKSSHQKFFKLNGTNANMDDIKQVVAQIGTLTTLKGILLYIDELHYLNKKQQQSILEYIENGNITLIGSTTENINFSIFNSLLSRCSTIEFKPLTTDNITDGLKRAIIKEEERLSVKIHYEDEALKYISEVSGGDLRRALNTLELIINTYMVYETAELFIDIKKANECSQSKIMYHDKDGDGHYNLMSYFQKCIRGSDPQASIHALARLIKGGDLNSICRRLLVIASEDIGLAYPKAICVVKSCVDAAFQIGLPEAKIPLAQAVLLLTLLPKSNSAYRAINEALNDLDSKDTGRIPDYLCDGYSNHGRNNKKRYLYPHDYPNHFVEQDYMPKNIRNKKYYEFDDNKFEKSLKDYWDRLKSKK